MQVTYGNITLQIVHTKECSRVAILSDDGTELLYTRHNYQFDAIYNRQAMAYTSPGNQVDGTEAAVTDSAIRFALMQPRKKLLIVADDPGRTVVLQSPAPGFLTDANNGPIPLSCVVNSITPATWRVSWRVKVDVIECGTVDEDTTPIISNRYSQTQQTGLDHRTTIVTRGVTVFRTDQLQSLGTVADHYRDECLPGLPLNYQRQSINISVSSQANILTWQVVDQEMFVSIGAADDARTKGVVKFAAMFSTRSAPLDQDNQPSNFVLAQFDATAWGDANSSRGQMFQWLAALAVERCSIPNGVVDPEVNPMIMGVSTEEAIDEPRVSLHVTLRIPPAKQVAQGFGALRTDFIGIDIINAFANDGKSPQFPSDGNTRGTSNAELLVSALKAACADPPPPPDKAGSSVGSANDNYQESTIRVQVDDSPIPTTDTSNYSSDATDNGTYTSMTVETSYATKRGVLACPVAAPSRGAAQNSGGTGVPPPYQPGLAPPPTAPTNDVEILTVCRDMTTVTYKWEAERTSNPPAIPHPQVNDKNLVLLSDELLPMAIGVAPDGFTPVFRIGGVYIYAAKNARDVAGRFALGVHPWTSFDYNDDVANVLAESFQHGIIDSNGSTESAFETEADDDQDSGDGGGGPPPGGPPGLAY